MLIVAPGHPGARRCEVVEEVDARAAGHLFVAVADIEEVVAGTALPSRVSCPPPAANMVVLPPPVACIESSPAPPVR